MWATNILTADIDQIIFDFEENSHSEAVASTSKRENHFRGRFPCSGCSAISHIEGGHQRLRNRFGFATVSEVLVAIDAAVLEYNLHIDCVAPQGIALFIRYLVGIQDIFNLRAAMSAIPSYRAWRPAEQKDSPQAFVSIITTSINQEGRIRRFVVKSAS